MTIIGILSSIFPIAHALLILYTFVRFLHHPGILTFFAILFTIYLLPPLLFRLYCLKYPIKTGAWTLDSNVRNDWWVAYQLQMIYAVIPAFEAFLRLVPEVYSLWLRLWGSKVGKGVYWTVLVEILDRHLIQVEDNVIFGHRVQCTSHIIHKKPNGDLVLVLRKIHIGKNSFVGACSRIGPGVKIPEETVVPYNTEYRFAYE